jgi:hypothetical protein
MPSRRSRFIYGILAIFPSLSASAELFRPDKFLRLSNPLAA